MTCSNGGREGEHGVSHYWGCVQAGDSGRGSTALSVSFPPRNEYRALFIVADEESTGSQFSHCREDHVVVPKSYGVIVVIETLGSE